MFKRHFVITAVVIMLSGVSGSSPFDDVLVTTGGGNGGGLWTQGTIAADDTTPTIEDLDIVTTSANTGATAITTFDDATAGQIFVVCGGSNTNSSTIADSGNFNLEGALTLSEDNCITLYTVAADDFIEVSRGIGARYFESVTLSGLLTGQNSETISNATDGKWIFAGAGGSNNEDLTLDFETTSNEITITSSTGVTDLELGTIGLKASTLSLSGTLTLETTGSYSLTTTDASSSGTASPHSVTGTINQSGTAGYHWSKVNPTLSASGSGNKYLSWIGHDGTATWKVETDVGVIIGDSVAGVDYTLTFDGENNDGTITFDEDNNRFSLSDQLSSTSLRATSYFELGSGASYFQPTTDDGLHIFVNASDGNMNNNFIIGPTAGGDYDHETASPNPTIFIHSSTSPNDSNSEYIGQSHNKSDALYTSGFGGFSWGIDDQPARGTLTVNGTPTLNDTFVVNATTFTAKDAQNNGADEFLRTGTTTQIAAAIVAVINLGSESSNAHAFNTANVVTIEWLTKGTAGNSIVFTNALTNVTIDGSGTLGGTHLGVASTTLMTLEEDGTLTVPTYTRHVDIEAGAASVGVTAPDAETVGTFRGLGFDADAETANMSFEVPDDWAGGTSDDMTLKIYWVPTAGDAIADTETVKWDISYRSIDFENNEVYDNGSATSGTVTYTQSGAGTDKSTFVSEITLDADDANNALVKGEVIGFEFSRDVTGDTYSGEAIVIRWEIAFDSTTMPKH